MQVEPGHPHRHLRLPDHVRLHPGHGASRQAPQNTAALLEAVTGLSFTAEQVVEVGERVNNLARAFNVREGFTRADDTLPSRLMEEPLKEGGSQGETVGPEQLKAMLDEYYTARGWEVETGKPTGEKLSALGIGYAAGQIQV